MKTKFPVAVIVVIVIVGILTSLYAYSVYFPHSSDRKMEGRFLNNEADFNRMVEMFGEDAEIDMIIDGKVYASGNAITEERLAEYKTLLDKTKVAHGIRRIRNAQEWKIILLSTSASDVPDEYYQSHTTAKGYVYSRIEPTPLVDSLDNANKTSYKKIKENWYLYYTEGTSKPE